ncbi:hypothetical protein [Paenibacillus macquariensis]|uniref:Uncharacterized protein n=1 Tax=Paenibacillus macquariensis TaxID=948756 RepID=A0ABY1JLZ1_9BACL|nr:hypothetical protein [Paenibacillus macquariensis]MEC0090599.1 hypothetical protein [Paenibacillus macquariensis]OAB25020.1 hypothetical protein PMSM_28730 [Paenibacillus macquariensis subsp. macquariensis]SIQ44594.1 hypothetical protein SAMN05421578_10225 [Paenibacillus macquariensis]
MRLKYFQRKKAQKQIKLIQEELVFYEPFYQSITQDDNWFIDNWNYLQSITKEHDGTDGLEEKYLLGLFLELRNQLTELTRIVDNYRGNIDISFFKDYIDQINKRITTKDNKEEIMIMMFFYSEMYEGAKRYERLKGKEKSNKEILLM